MESQQELQKVLQQLADTNRKQVRYARLQCFFTVLAAVFCLLLLLTAARIVPQVQQLATQISSLSEQAAVVLTNLETVTKELAETDISGMVAEVDSLVVSSQAGIEQALAKINAIDIDTLNTAIENLSKIVGPLANLINRFK